MRSSRPRSCSESSRGCTILFVAGLADDVYSLRPLAKLAAQFAAAGIVLASGLSVEIVGYDVLATVLGLVWLVGITNAFNLLDNMDGLAATLAAVVLRRLRGRRGRASDAEPTSCSSLALALGFACARLPAVQPAPGPRRRRSSWATPAAR